VKRRELRRLAVLAQDGRLDLLAHGGVLTETAGDRREAGVFRESRLRMGEREQ
jgi:hypothetical protein